MGYIVSYTQSDYNGNSTSGVLNSAEYTSFSVSSFRANSLAPFLRTNQSFNVVNTLLTNVTFSESSFNEEGGVFSNSLQNLTISVGLDPSLTYSTYYSSYSTKTASYTCAFSSIDSPMVIYTLPIGEEYALPSADVEVANSSVTYRKLRFIAAGEEGGTQLNLLVTSSINSSSSYLSSSAGVFNVSSKQNLAIVGGSMPSASVVHLTTCERITTYNSFTFNLTSADVSTAVSGLYADAKNYYGTASVYSTATETVTATRFIIDPVLSQVSLVEVTGQYGVVTAIGSVRCTGTLENVITGSSSTAHTGTFFNSTSKTGRAYDFQESATYFISTIVDYKSDTFRQDSVETVLKTSTVWLQAGDANYYSVRESVSYNNISVFTQSVFSSLSTTASARISSTYQNYPAYVYSEESSTSSVSQDYDIYCGTTTYSTLEYLISNDNFSVTTIHTSSNSAASTAYLATSETSSCDITGYAAEYGYAYYTTFYGKLANDTFYTTRWVNSAVVNSSTEYRENGLTLYTIGYTDKTFGNPINSTTIHDENIISSKVYVTSLVVKTVSELSVDTGTVSSVDAPIEYFTTGYESFRKSTMYGTYIGPKTVSERFNTYYDYNVSVTEIGSYTYDWEFIGSQLITSSVFNTSDYGTTYRLSELIGSSSWFIPGNVNGTVNYRYSYDVNSMFSFNDIISTLSNYTTMLATSYQVAYSIDTEQDTYAVTKSSSLAAKSSGERFIDRVEISRTSTIDYGVTNQIAVYNGSTMTTLGSTTASYNMQSEQDVSTVARTFISSTADLDVTTEIASSTTETAANGSFIYSSRELVSSTMEQQNDTLIFASTFNTYSFYNSSYTTSTLNTVASTLSATTYEDWYDPISWTSTALSIATSTGAAETVNTTSGIVSITQSVNYTPVYEDVDGIYITTN